MKTLAQWLSYIGQLHAKEISLGLERVKKVVAELKLAFDCPVITVTGTNGKGSCVKILESILIASGYQVGAYSSPHLLAFNERIRINNHNIDDDTLCRAFTKIDQARKETPLTFFEFTTLTALWIFKQQTLDVLILEVGLGGRLDAVNCIDCDLAIVTSIALDHTDWLGHSLEAIGFEKAGIFRQKSIAICGDPSPPLSLMQQAVNLEVELFCAQRDFGYEIGSSSWSWFFKDIVLDNLPFSKLSLKNVSTALMAITKLSEQLLIPITAVHQGIAGANLAGRFQQIKSPFSCILDVAHNPAAAELLAEQIEQQFPQQKLIAVVGMLRDKDIQNTLRPLDPWVKEWHIGSLNVPRGANCKQLACYVQDFTQSKWYTYECIPDAFKQASETLNPGETILVFGSFYTVAEVLNMLQNDHPHLKEEYL